MPPTDSSSPQNASGPAVPIMGGPAGNPPKGTPVARPAPLASAAMAPTETAGDETREPVRAEPGPVAMPTPEDISAIHQSLVAAVGGVTGQPAAEVEAFAAAMAPTFAVYSAMERAGDERAAQALDAGRRMAIMYASNFGIRLLQSHEQALLGAIGVALSLLGGGTAAAAAAPAVGAAAMAMAGALAKK